MRSRLLALAVLALSVIPACGDEPLPPLGTPADVSSNSDALAFGDITGKKDAGPDATKPDATDADGGQADASEAPDVADVGDDVAPDVPPVKDTSGQCESVADCDDGDACTADSCQFKACIHDPKTCDDGLDCTDDACDAKTGNCTAKPKAGQCFIDNACQAPGPSSKDPCLACQPDKSQVAWTALTGKTCDDGAACTENDVCTAAGVCAGKPKAKCCQGDGDCASGDPCQVGSCDVASGSCSYQAKAGCCSSGACCDVASGTVKPKGTVCAAQPIGAEFQCAGQNVQKRDLLPACDGKDAKSCPTDAASGAWSPWQTVATCGADSECKLTDAKTPPACVPKTTTGCKSVAECDDKNPCTEDACTGGQCSHAPKSCPDPSTCQVGKCEAATGKCISELKTGRCKISGQCYADGNANPADACQVCDSTQSTSAWSAAPACKCTGTVCCDGGKIAPKATKCGTTVAATEYGCSADGKATQKRVAYQGCTGNSTTCSISSSNYAWQPWMVEKTCASTEVCVAGSSASSPATCKSSKPQQCTPGSTCCTADGQYIAKGTKCGLEAWSTEYKCTATTPGGAMQFRKQYAGCSGTSTSCSTLYGAWSEWATFKTCGSSEVCKAGFSASQLPTCEATTSTAPTCPTTDPWENDGTPLKGKELADKTDADAAMILDPKITLNNATDSDAVQVYVFDDINFDDPEVYVDFQAASGTVTVCAYYACDAGANGTDCAKATCYFGSKAAFSSAVSSVDPNGCCITAKSGTIEWTPDAPASSDESGQLYVTVKNGISTCQQVSLKLAFGGDTWTPCNPGSQCCTATGEYAKKGTQCGTTAWSTEYKCATTTSGPQVQVRKEYSGCTGTSTLCSSSDENLVWSAWTPALPCLADEVCVTPSASTMGKCKLKGAGSCASSCGGQSKEGACFCDEQCAVNGDCCTDFQAKCGGSCKDSCGGKAKDGVCYCDSLCKSSGDCCLDKAKFCP